MDFSDKNCLLLDIFSLNTTKNVFLNRRFFKTAAFSPREKNIFPIYILADPSAGWYNLERITFRAVSFFE